jgi:hypothetical protein
VRSPIGPAAAGVQAPGAGMLVPRAALRTGLARFHLGGGESRVAAFRVISVEDPEAVAKAGGVASCHLACETLSFGEKQHSQ